MRAFQKISSRAVPLRADHVDTDQIIPARYLTTLSKLGLGKGLFDAWRYQAPDQANPDFVLNKAEFQGSEILLAGENFGCGSSREHAVWALTDYGFRAVIAESFADIFMSNSLKNGLLPVALKPEQIEALFQQAESTNPLPIEVCLETQTVSSAMGHHFNFEISPFRKDCLLRGLDDLGYLVEQLPDIESFEEKYELISSP